MERRRKEHERPGKGEGGDEKELQRDGEAEPAEDRTVEGEKEMVSLGK